MTAWLISQAAPYLIGLMALLGVYLRGRASARAEERDAAMKRMIRRTTKRTEIEDAIDQDTDLVRRAHASGLVRPDGK